MNTKTLYPLVNSLWEVENISLAELFAKSEKTLLYFYPKDNTPGCTLENKDFTCEVQKFKDLWITLVGVSKDSVESHKKFIVSQWLQNSLISDPELVLHKELWAFGEKNNYGKIIQWVIRSTFLFNSKWEILKSWKNVKATGHVAKVLREIGA